MTEHLHHKLATLLQSLRHGKLPRSLHWSDALELIGHVGQVQPLGADEFAFVVGTEREVFKRPRTPEIGVEEVSRLRKLINHAASDAPPAKADHSSRMAVVIDHHGAHVYRDLGQGAPETPVSIEPYDPHHFHHHLIHRKEAHYQGDRVPEETSFYEEVASALVSANEIVLIGHGTGKSSAVHFLAEHLKKHHIDISRRVQATETADLSALTEPEMEALAKKHMIAAV
jgi:hypothetical protein